MSLPRRKRGAVHDRMVTTSMALFEATEELAIYSREHNIPREKVMADAAMAVGGPATSIALLDMLWPK